jgi:hypothetical protein
MYFSAIVWALPLTFTSGPFDSYERVNGLGVLPLLWLPPPPPLLLRLRPRMRLFWPGLIDEVS